MHTRRRGKGYTPNFWIVAYSAEVTKSFCLARNMYDYDSTTSKGVIVTSGLLAVLRAVVFVAHPVEL